MSPLNGVVAMFLEKDSVNIILTLRCHSLPPVQRAALEARRAASRLQGMPHSRVTELPLSGDV